jgi:hypothetical protein
MGKRRATRRQQQMRILSYHPAWTTVHTVASTAAVTVGVAVILWVTANSFDANEVKAIAGTVGATATIMSGLNRWIQGRMDDHPDA